MVQLRQPYYCCPHSLIVIHARKNLGCARYSDISVEGQEDGKELTVLQPREPFDLHFFLKRAHANSHAFGDSRWHRDRVADLAGV